MWISIIQTKPRLNYLTTLAIQLITFNGHGNAIEVNIIIYSTYHRLV